MATIVQGVVPAEEFALYATLEALPAAEIECERIVDAGEGSVLPLLWFHHVDRETVEAALGADPTVETVRWLAGSDGEYLYGMEWTDQIRLLLHMITNEQATMLNAYARRHRWHLRLLYPTRAHFSRTHEFAQRHRITFEVVSIREIEGNRIRRFGLTEEQYRAFMLAVERGFYDIPRAITLEELADELDISHQALSERVRRGTKTLLMNLFFSDLIVDENE